MQPGRGARVRLAAFALCLLGCAQPESLITARLALAELPSCALPKAERRMWVRASGDFPTEERALSGDAPYAIDGFPASTRFLSIEVHAGAARAGSLVALGGREQRARALLLPLSRSCPLGDPLVSVRPGAAVAALPRGGLLIAGGADARGASSSAAARLDPGAALAVAVDAGMLLRRAFATATRTGERVVIAGGAPDARGPAHDTFEVYDAALGAFDTARSAKLAAGPRRDHGAATLPDGRVLIAGGVAELGAAPLSSAEILDVDAGRAIRTEGDLNTPRTAPTLLVLDSGAVLVALGRGEDGRPVSAVERFDPEAQRFELVAELPAHAHAVAVALEGERVAYLGCDPEGPCELVFLLPRASGFERVASALSGAELEERGVRGLEHLRALALRDGRLLVTGRDPTAVIERTAFVIDPNELAVARVETTRLADVLIALEDGAMAELNAEGGSLRREDVRSELDDPSTELLGGDALGVALDAAERWERTDAGLRAIEQARFDLPHLRFAALRLTLSLRGEAQLLLEPEGAKPVEVLIAERRIALGACELARDPEEPLALERRGGELLLRAAEGTRSCAAPALDGRVGLALRAAEGTVVTSLRVERL